MGQIQFETVGRAKLAFLHRIGAFSRCGYFWLGGYKSDMTGSKAEAVAALAHEEGRSCLRFDYSGHGASGGRFEDGTISRWLAEAVHFFRRTEGRQVVLGSSMGGFLALLLLRRLLAEDVEAAKRFAGLVLIAPAADMTTELMWKEFPADVRASIERDGIWHRPSAYGERYPITWSLIEDGRQHVLLDAGLDCPCPVRILQGDVDRDVPAAHAMKVFGALRGADITLTLIKGGDHRLSTPTQLALMRDTAARLAAASDLA